MCNSRNSNEKTSIEKPNSIIAEMLKEDWSAIDRRINKETGIWKRAQQQIGIPLSPETKEKISQALTGRKLSSATRTNISMSLKSYNKRKKEK